MGNAFWFAWEPEVVKFFQNGMTPFLQKIAEIVTYLGDEYAMILIVLFLYWCYRKELGRKLGIYAMGALVTSIAVKDAVMRRRPYYDHTDIKCLKARASDADPYDVVVQGYSFPSGHATNTVSTYVALGLNVGKKVLKVVLFALPILVGLSRVALGVHYPTDILAGWVLSALVIFVISRIKNQHAAYLLIALVGIAGCFFGRSTDYYSSLGLALGFIAGFLFEEKVVCFQNTRSVVRMILRTVGGLGVFLALNTLLKLPFSEELLEGETAAAFAVRAARYAVTSFVLVGVYPMAFGFVDRKILKKKAD